MRPFSFGSGYPSTRRCWLYRLGSTEAGVLRQTLVGSSVGVKHICLVLHPKQLFKKPA